MAPRRTTVKTADEYREVREAKLTVFANAARLSLAQAAAAYAAAGVAVFPCVPGTKRPLAEQVEGVTKTRLIDGGVELHVTGPERLVPRVVGAAEGGGFDLVDLSISEPSLETVFISLTGKELRD